METAALGIGDKERIRASIRQKYGKVAGSPEGSFSYPTGRAGLEALRYLPEMLGKLPEAVIASYCGVGNPFSLGPVRRGELVLDIGCGGGVDTLIAAALTGAAGGAVGVDLVSQMVERAKENLGRSGVENAHFCEASGENLPFADASFEVVISNGVFNLFVDKAGAIREAYRVLKPGGRFMIADEVLTGIQSSDPREIVASWSR